MLIVEMVSSAYKVFDKMASLVVTEPTKNNGFKSQKLIKLKVGKEKKTYQSYYWRGVKTFEVN